MCMFCSEYNRVVVLGGLPCTVQTPYTFGTSITDSNCKHMQLARATSTCTSAYCKQLKTSVESGIPAATDRMYMYSVRTFLRGGGGGGLSKCRHTRTVSQYMHEACVKPEQAVI